ncbi:hypothetical protein QJQ45_002787 [Haematococcus lacustris]|nr:hypothetical protein QJQ45_002787 [Haematococcus lacustris]
MAVALGTVPVLSSTTRPAFKSFSTQLRAFLGLNGHIPVESFHWLLASSIAESAVLEPICDAYAQCLQDWGDLSDREEAITELLRLVQEHLIDPPSYQPGLDPAIVLGSDKHSNASVFTLAYRHAALQAVNRGTFSYSAAIDHLFTHCLQVPSLQQSQREGLKRDAVRIFQTALPDAEDRHDLSALEAALKAVSQAYANLLDCRRYEPEAAAPQRGRRAEAADQGLEQEVIQLRKQLASMHTQQSRQLLQPQRQRQWQPQPAMQPMPQPMPQPMHQPMHSAYAALPAPSAMHAYPPHMQLEVHRTQPVQSHDCDLHQASPAQPSPAQPNGGGDHMHMYVVRSSAEAPKPHNCNLCNLHAAKLQALQAQSIGALNMAAYRIAFMKLRGQAAGEAGAGLCHQSCPAASLATKRSCPVLAGARAAALLAEAGPQGAAGGRLEASPAPSSSLQTTQAELLRCVASLDRGLAATAREVREVQRLVAALTAACPPPVLSWAPLGHSSLDQLQVSLQYTALVTASVTCHAPCMLPLRQCVSVSVSVRVHCGRCWRQGCWRLLYTSGFNTGSLGGQRPGPPAALVPVALGQIYQVIDASQARLDNVVEFLLPALPLLGSEGGGPVLRLTLGHEYQVQGARSLQIVYESTQAQLLGAPHGLSQLPSWALPQLPPFLQPPRSMRSATFDVVFLDDMWRVTRGDRGELRLYVRDTEAGARLAAGRSQAQGSVWPPSA